MFEFDFATEHAVDIPPITAAEDFDSVHLVHLVTWEEHCLECAVPACFETCPLYSRRADGLCARFQNGIVPNPGAPGLLQFGADITYKRWGKLECKLEGFAVAPRTLRLLTRIDLLCSRVAGALGRTVNPITRMRKINTHIIYAKLRRLLLATARRVKTTSLGDYDTFLADLINPSDEPLTLILEVERDEIEVRRALTLQPGANRFELDAAEVSPSTLATANSPTPASMRLYPAGDKEARIIVRSLHFVATTTTDDRATTAEDALVKCVTWDLDNTLWNGTLVESEPDELELRPGVADAIATLDARGVLQSISSKNDHDQAWPVLERLGIADYFLYPAINWQPKSKNIALIAESLNLGLDSFVHIDDSHVERAEISQNQPSVRVLDEEQISSLPSLAGIPRKVTAESRRRRMMYVEESHRRIDATDFGEDHLAFLRACRLVATVGRPSSDEDRIRCLELLQRTNQLNISKRSYTDESLQELFRSPDHAIEAISCSDAYGHYGLVGLVIVRLDTPEPVVTDFVLSCRVAKKLVEPAVFSHLRHRLDGRKRSLRLLFRPSQRNRALFDVLLDVGFTEVSRTDDEILMVLDDSTVIADADVVEVVETVTT